MNQRELMNCAICIVIGFLLYSFIQNGFCGKKNLVEGYLAEGTDCNARGRDCSEHWFETSPAAYGKADPFSTSDVVTNCRPCGETGKWQCAASDYNSFPNDSEWCKTYKDDDGKSIDFSPQHWDTQRNKWIDGEG